jgi:CobQ/CobB/MinD/ParA nucleotide binding domain
MGRCGDLWSPRACLGETDKEAKSPKANSGGLTGLGCRYNGKPVSKEAEFYILLSVFRSFVFSVLPDCVFCLFIVRSSFMALLVGLVSQKGGVGKSTLARLVAREYAAAGWNVKIADLDTAQGTSFSWQARRLQHAIEPAVAVERFGSVEAAVRIAEHYDLMLLDGAPHSTAATLKIAQASAMVGP